MPDQIVPPPVIIAQQKITWPRILQQGTFAAPNANGNEQFAVSPNFTVMANASGTWSTRVFPAGAGVLCGLLGNAGAGLSAVDFDDLVAAVPLTLASGNIPTQELIGPEIFRVTRYTWWAALIGTNIANVDDAIGMVVQPQAGGSTGNPTLGNPGFGFTGDTAGSWNYNNFQSGAFPANRTETVNFPAGTITDVTAYNYFDIEIINASPTRQAFVSMKVNNVDIASRNWVQGGGGELADYTTVGGGLGSVMKGIQFYVDNTATADVGIQIANVEITHSRYTRDQVELLN